jgi:hypothetical protein
VNIATAVLVPLCALVLVFAGLAVGRLVKAWRARHELDEVEVDPERLALLDEKQRLLQMLADLEHEHGLGKLSDSDYTGLKRHFQREILRVLDRLERGATPSPKTSTPEAA